MSRYALISLPQSAFDSGDRDEAISSLSATITSDNGTVLPFGIPDFKIGTLDLLVQQADDLAKLEGACQSVVAKVADSLRTVLNNDEDRMASYKMVNDKPTDHYLRNFSWNKMRYRADKPIADLISTLQKELNTVDNDVKSKFNQYNAVKTNLAQLQRKQTGTLATKSLTPIVKPSLLVQDSEYLETHLIAVPTNAKKDFVKSYETLAPMVVPRSSVEIDHDDEFTLFAVVTFKKHSAEFVHKCREQKWTPRQYKYVEGGREEEQRELDRVTNEERKVCGEALRMGRTGWSESVMIWVHVLTLRVFVEAVLRYGLPLDYATALIKTTPKLAPKAKAALDSKYSYLGGNAFGRDKHGRVTKDDAALSSEMAAAGLGTGEGNEYTAFDGSGAYQDGSLRSIRSGVGLEDRGLLDEIEGTRGLFTLRSVDSVKADTVVISTLAGTRVLRFEPDNIEELFSFQGMDLESPTLLAANLPSGQVLQITPQAVNILDPDSGVSLSSWQAPEGKTITAASANTKWALLSVDGSILVSLNLLDNLKATTKDASQDSVSGRPDQISCIHAARDPQDFGVVGWWTSGTISVVDMATLTPLHGEPLRQTDDSASVPRDVALVQLHPPESSGPTMLVALEDGNVISFNVSVKGFAISGRKTVTLGSGPARLHVLPREDGICNVFATTEHASLIYSSQGRIVYSATTAADATFVAPFDSEAFPDSIVLSTEDHIRICHVDNERLTHVKALPMYETVRRVAYSPGLRAFGLGCIKKELVNNEEVITSTVKLVDEIIFQELGTPFLLNASSSLELVECVIRAELPDANGNLAERFLVGTSFVADQGSAESGETKGRILVLGVDESRQLYQIASHNLKGVCRCLVMMNNYIVAGLTKTVVAYSYNQDTSTSASLTKLASFRPASFPVDLDVSGNIIGIGDLMQSLTLVEFTPPQDGKKAKLEEKARHYQQAWTTSISALDDSRWLEADAQGNIIVLRQNLEAPTEQDQSQLQVISELNIGEQINRIRKLQVAPGENAIVVPKAFLGSIEGTLYLYGDIAPKYQDLLMTFQSRLQEYISTPGNLSFDLWRAFRNQSREGEAPFRFVDGEMIERFLDLDEGKQELVCEGLGPSVEDMRNLIEELRRMH